MRCKKIIFFILLAFIGASSVQAETATVEYQTGIFSHRIENNTVHSGQLGYLLVDGNIVYCLEPYQIVGDNYQLNNDYLNQFSKEDKEYFELVAGYVKDKVERKEIYYYMAAQELIWERMIGDNVYWTTKLNGGDEINIDAYKQEINSYLKNIKPSINNIIVQDKFFSTVVLEDTNNVLNDYEIVSNTKSEVIKSGNKLYIKILSSEEEIKLIKKIDNGSSYYYHSNKSQDLVNLSGSVNLEASIKIKATNKYSVPALFNFYDTEFSTYINGGTKFKLHNLDTDEYSPEFITYNGKLEIPYLLETGNYQLILTDVPKNYLIEDNYFFTITDDIPHEYSPGEFFTVNTYLNKATGKIIINNHKEETIYSIYASKNIYDIHNNIIYKKDQWIRDEIIQDKGMIDVPLGDYYIIDNTTQIKYEITLEYQDPYTKVVEKTLDIFPTEENSFPEEIKPDDTFPVEKEEKIDQKFIIHSKTLPNTYNYMGILKGSFIILMMISFCLTKKCSKKY